MNLQILILAILARWPVVVATALLTALVTLGVSLLIPKTYQATASVVVDMKSLEPIAGALSQAQLMPSYMATQIDIITSPKVLSKAVRNLNLAEDPLARRQYEAATGGNGGIDLWLVETMRERIKVKPSKDSGVVALTYSGSSPDHAARVANALAQAYLETNLEMRVEPARQNAAWFDERSKVLRERLNMAQAKLSAFQKSTGIVSADERADVETAKLNELSSQLSAAQGASAETSSRQRQTKAGDPQHLPDVVSSPLIQSLKTDLSREEAKLGELVGQLGENHPAYQRQLSEVRTMRSRLSAEIQRISASISTANQISQSKEAELRTALDAQRQKLLKLRERRDELSVLQREVDSAQKAYDIVAARYTQTSLESQTTLTNVSILNPAEPPLRHSSPTVTLNTLASLLVGGAMGIGLALLFEMLDRRVRTSNDLATAVEAPVLCVLDATKTGGAGGCLRGLLTSGGSAGR